MYARAVLEIQENTTLSLPWLQIYISMLVVLLLLLPLLLNSSLFFLCNAVLRGAG